MKPIKLTPPSNSNVPSRKQKGYYEISRPIHDPAVLRKMDHADWLETFARVMTLETGVEMTPMRAGVINRCEMAAAYIKLLQYENRILNEQRSAALAQQANGGAEQTNKASAAVQPSGPDVRSGDQSEQQGNPPCDADQRADRDPR